MISRLLSSISISLILISTTYGGALGSAFGDAAAGATAKQDKPSVEKKPAPVKPDSTKPSAPDEEAEEILSPGSWDLVFGLDDQLYPSAIIALSTLRTDELDITNAPTEIGAPLGMAGISIRGTGPGDRITVEISSTKLIRPSRIEAVLENPNLVYDVYPYLLYDYDQLLSVRQPYPEDITVKVTLNGKSLGEKTQTLVVRSINDCFFAVRGEGEDEWIDWSEMFAAYVNESHPVVEEILGEALAAHYVSSFAGYQRSAADVKKEINAVWKVLKKRGVKYSNITTSSAESDFMMSQHVRLIGESIRNAQANCVDGSVLLASIFRKLGLNAYLIIAPDHMWVAVDLDNDGEETAFIETTMLSSATLAEAMSVGENELEEYGEDNLFMVDINEARNAGIMSLRDIAVR